MYKFIPALAEMFYYNSFISVWCFVPAQDMEQKLPRSAVCDMNCI